MKVCLLILVLDVSACFSAKTVADFSFVTWNADGARHWNAVKHYFLKSNVDLMAIQAAAELPYYPGLDVQTIFRAVPEGDSLPTTYLGAITAKPAFQIEEYLWNLTDHDQIYLYYYTNQNEVLPFDQPASGTENLAILSRHKAHKLFLLPTVDAEGKFVEPLDDSLHPPLMGLRIESALFFNIHSRNGDDAAIEATSIVNRITNITAAYYPTLTWALMGNFDQMPADLIEELAQQPSPPANTFRRVVATGAATRVPRPRDKRKNHPNSFDKMLERKNRKHSQNRRFHSFILPQELQQLPKAAVPVTTVPVTTVPLRKVPRKHRKHFQRVAYRIQSWKNRPAAASREVDYAVFGGPSTSRHIMKSVNVELLKNYFARVKIPKYTRNPSHHLPLIFNKQL